MSVGSGEFSINRPAPRASTHAWTEPPAPSNPAVRGLPLAIGAAAISRLGFLQQLLWNNAGFSSLRDRPELDGTEARYDPTVIRTTGVSAKVGDEEGHGQQLLSTLLAEDWSSKTSGAQTKKVHLSVLDYHEAYKTGKTTPLAVAKALLPLIRKDGTTKNASKHATAFLQVREHLVLKAAEESTQRYKAGKPLSPLDGVPVAVKDEVDVAGYGKCYGSKIDFTDKADGTAFCVRKWQEAGAVLLGKTLMHEMGSDITNNNANYGTPRNPNNEDYYTGGSSGGSAYTVAAGLSPLCEGNDGGGSIRVPSNYCGIYGLKTTHGRVSKAPGINLAKSTAVCGPMAADMLSLEIGYRLMAQPDAQEADSALFIPPGSVSLKSPNRKKVLGIYKPWFDRADPIVQQKCQDIITHLTTNEDYTTIDITIPLLHEGQTAHAITILSELCSGIHPSNTHKLTAPNQVVTSVARKTTAVDLLQSQRLRNLLMQHLSYLYTEHPGLIIVTPTTPEVGWKIELGDLAYGFTDGNKQIKNMEYVWLANFTGNPAISVPCGYAEPAKGTTGRIPIGFMGMADWCSEDSLIAFGYDCERYVNEVLEGGRSKPINHLNVLELVAKGGNE